MHARLFSLAAVLLAAMSALPLAFGVASAAALPGADTGGASAVTYSSAVLNGGVVAKGQPTNYFFQYGTTRGYGAQTPLAPGGTATTTNRVSQPISGLQALTLYHFRLVAISASGRTNGVDHTFRTPKVPLSLQLAGTPNPVPFGESFLVEGALSGTGSANHPIVLQANPFPYTAGFKTLGNPELTNAAGGFSFPVLGLLENAQVRVQTLGSPTITSPVVLEERRRQGCLPRASHPPPRALASVWDGLAGRARCAGRLSAARRRWTHRQRGRHDRQGRLFDRLELLAYRPSAPLRGLPRAREDLRRRARLRLQRAGPGWLTGAVRDGGCSGGVRAYWHPREDGRFRTPTPLP